MSRKILVIAVTALICFICLSGCKKGADESETSPEKTEATLENSPESKPLETGVMSEHQIEAKKQINKKNMDEELEKIEASLEKELSEGQ